MILGGGRATEARFAEEDVLQSIDHVGLGVADVESQANAFGKVVEGRERGRRIDLGPPVRGDRKRASGKIDVGLVLGDQPGETRAICRSGCVVVDHGWMVTPGRPALNEWSSNGASGSAFRRPRAMLRNPYWFGRVCVEEEPLT